MIINFSELSIPFHRLAAGTILISPWDVRYMRVYNSDLDLVWVSEWGINNGTVITNTVMKQEIGSGEGWKVLP